MNKLLETVKAVLSTSTIHWLSLTESLPLILGSGHWRPFFQDHDVSR